MPTATAQVVSQLQRSIARAIYGKQEAIQLALITLLARGHLLIEDVPGVGKTTLAQALAKSFHCTFQRIQFTSDLLPSDVLGVSVYNPESREFDFRSGPIFANVVLADEINRTTPRTQSALLEAMNEAQVTVDGKTLSLPRPFLVIATQNPVEHHGTYPLPESQLDRFLMRIKMGYPSHETEREILRKRVGDPPLESLEPIADVADVLSMQEAVAHVKVDSSLHDYALEIVNRTRKSEHLALGVSPRGTLMLQRAAQARAFLDTRDYCIPDDFKHLAVAVFAHRVVGSSRHAS
jgi:MoxR-like ATPase